MTGVNPSWQEAVRATLERGVGDGKLAGALAVAWHDRAVALSEAAGHRDIASGLAMSRDSIFQIASMTKPIVSIAALQLVDEGAIRLGDPIAPWLPEFAHPRVLDDPTGPLERSHPASRPITIDDLLSHRAGFGYAFTSFGPIAEALQRGIGNVLHSTLDPDQWLTALAGLPLLSEPGVRFVYGHSTEVLGCLIARLDGNTLGESLDRRVFAPLGMRDTGFFVPPGKLSRLAHMYRRGTAGLTDVTDAPTAPPLFEAGGGGLYSAAADYLIFARMLLGNGELDGVRLLSARTYDLMTRNQLTGRQRLLGGLGRSDFFAHTGFGYGVQVVMEPAPPLFAGTGSLSWGGIFGTGWRADPSNKLITLFFAQDVPDTSSGPEGRDAAQVTPAARLQAEFEQLVYSGLVDQEASARD